MLLSLLDRARVIMLSQMAVSWAIAGHNRGVGEFEELISAAVPSIEALIPADPAAELGRYEPRQWSGRPEYGAPAQRALDDFPGLTAERLLGALELGVARLTLTAPADVVAGLQPLPDESSSRSCRSVPRVRSRSRSPWWPLCIAARSS
jgi:hypothetical protein